MLTLSIYAFYTLWTWSHNIVFILIIWENLNNLSFRQILHKVHVILLVYYSCVHVPNVIFMGQWYSWFHINQLFSWSKAMFRLLNEKSLFQNTTSIYSRKGASTYPCPMSHKKGSQIISSLWFLSMEVYIILNANHGKI